MYTSPPPFDAWVLRLFKEKGKPGLPLMLVGDFTCWLNPRLDKNPCPGGARFAKGDHPGKNTTGSGMDRLWRHRNPAVKQFSCFSKSHASLSRIDLTVGNSAMLPSVLEISYKPRCVSDHSYMVVCLTVAPLSALPKVPWKFNAFWLKLFTSHEELQLRFWEFFTVQYDPEFILMEWEAFRVYLRGLLIAEVTKSSILSIEAIRVPYPLPGSDTTSIGGIL